jgi:hypothetical protein
MSDQPRCDGCFFWQLFDTPTPEDGEDPASADFVDLRTGRCHRFPPSLNATHLALNVPSHVKMGGITRHDRPTTNETEIAAGLTECGFSWVHPSTYASDFCGEWKAKEQARADDPLTPNPPPNPQSSHDPSRPV